MRHDYLAAMRGRHQPCRPVQCRTVIVAVTMLSLRRMQTNPHAQRADLTPRLSFERPLTVHRGRHPVMGRREHREHAVAQIS